MITRQIEKVHAKIVDETGATVERDFYGSAVTAIKIKKSYERETGMKVKNVTMDSETISVSMTEAEFVNHGKIKEN